MFLFTFKQNNNHFFLNEISFLFIESKRQGWQHPLDKAKLDKSDKNANEY